MNSIPAQDIKQRGISAVDDLLKDGPVHVIKNNRPRYVVMSQEDYARLIERRGLWELLDRPARGTRSKKDIDAQLRAERDGWRGTSR
jgi:PHD/YefM family antitoxin component YafN of YafNO toxin-antitoxin module